MEFVTQRRLGSFTIALVSEGEWRFPVEVVYAGGTREEWERELGATEAGSMHGMNVFVLAGEGIRLLVDAGVGDQDPCMPPPASEVRRRLYLGDGLAALGLQPEQITHVVLSHWHGDHTIGAVVRANGEERLRFPRARHLISRLDFEDALRSQHAESVGALLALQRLGALDLIDLPCDLAPGISLLWTPGHSAGHLTLRAESQGEVVYYLGDLLHHPAELRHLEWGGQDETTRRQLVASRTTIAEAALRERALVAISHTMAPRFARIERAGGELRWVEATD